MKFFKNKIARINLYEEINGKIAKRHRLNNDEWAEFEYLEGNTINK